MTLDTLLGHYHAHSWLMGGVVVVSTAYGRFNTPPTSRSSTTCARYHALAGVYALAFVASWIVLANAPEIIALLAKDLDLTDRLHDVEAPLYAAVVLAVLPGLGPFGSFDAKMRAFFQDLARIPWEAQRLSGALRARTWLPDGEFQGQIRATLREAGFNDLDVSFASDRTPQALWTRLTALRRYVESWESRPGKFAGFHFLNIAAIGELEEEYDGLEAKARRVFPLLKRSRGAGADAGLDPVVQELAGTFTAAAGRLEKSFCDLVSRGVLTCGLTGRARRAEFETIGFMVNSTPSPLFDNLLGLYLGLVALYVAVLTWVGRPRPLLSGVVIATIYLGAVVMALELKRSPWVAHLPIARHASSAAAAFAFASLTSMVLSLLTTFDVQVAWSILTTRWWPWGFMSATVAALLSARIDADERPGLGWQEAGLVGLACALVAIPVVWLLEQACSGGACEAPPTLRVMCTAGVTGSLIGFFVPTWYRRPEVMVSGYERFKVVVTARTSADGVAATIDVVPPRTSGAARPAAIRLPEEIEEPSADDAIAEAIRAARAWIDAQRAAAARAEPATNAA